MVQRALPHNINISLCGRQGRDEEIFKQTCSVERGNILTNGNIDLSAGEQNKYKPPKRIAVAGVLFTLHAWLKKYPFLFLSALVTLVS